MTIQIDTIIGIFQKHVDSKDTIFSIRESMRAAIPILRKVKEAESVDVGLIKKVVQAGIIEAEQHEADGRASHMVEKEYVHTGQRIAFGVMLQWLTDPEKFEAEVKRLGLEKGR